MEPSLNYRVRPALYSDNAFLLALVRNSSIETKDEIITFDRGEDFFAQLELQGRGMVIVAEIEGELAGCGIFSVYDTLIGGMPVRVAHKYLGRVSPSAQRRGVGECIMLAREREEAAVGATLWYAFNDYGNMAIQRLHARTLGVRTQNFSLHDFCTLSTHQLPHVRYSLLAQRTRHYTPDPHVRRWQLSELPHVVSLINHTHAGYDLFAPLTGECLLGRLSRRPSYTLMDLYVFEGGHRQILAAAGLWRMGDDMREYRVSKHTGVTREVRRAAIVDWGYQPDCPESMGRLVTELVHLAHTQGFHEVMFAEEEPRVGRYLDASIMDRPEAMLFYCRKLDEASPLPHTPLFLDPIFF